MAKSIDGVRGAATTTDILGHSFGVLTGRFANIDQAMKSAEAGRGKNSRRPRKRHSADTEALTLSPA